MLTPLDIENKEFKKRLGGYDRDDVESFLGLVLNDYEKCYKENIAYRDKVDTLTDAVNHFKAQEETLNNAIVSAQKAADTIIRNAGESADLIEREARLKADEIVRQAHTGIAGIQANYQKLKQEMENYKIRMSAIIKAQLDILNDITDAPQGYPGKDDEHVSREE